jgi:hypothetical protein
LSGLESPFPRPYFDIKVRRFNVRVEKLKEVYSEVCKRVCEAVIEEFQLYVKAIKYTGHGSKYPAVARGESDSRSLINSLELSKNDDGSWSILVMNQVFLYQEWGFDLSGVEPDEAFQDLIWRWALAKGLVQIRNVGTAEFLINNLKRSKMSRAERKEHYLKFARLRPGSRRGRSEEWRTVDAQEVLQQIDWGTEAGEALQTMKLRLAQGVIKNNSGQDNQRLFLTTAKINVFEDRMRIKQIEIGVLEEYGFRGGYMVHPKDADVWVRKNPALSEKAQETMVAMR